MNTLIYFQSAIAFGMGIISLYMVYMLMNRYIKKAIDLQETNTAYAILQSGVILSTALLVSSVIGPGINAIRFMNQDTFSWVNMTSSIGYIVLFLVIGIAFSLIVVAGGLITFFQLTNINEWEEIKKNNIAVALISASLILGLSIVVKDHIASLCEALIPYPDVLNIR